MAVYFAWCERQRSALRLALFVAACAATLGTSAFAAARLSTFLHGSGGAAGYLPLEGMACAGGVGTFLTLTATWLLFGPQGPSWIALFRILSGSVGGAVLGVAGAGVDRVLLHPPRDPFAAVFLLWQPGTALLMGLMLQSERKSPGIRASGNRPRWALAAIFFVCLLGFYGLCVLRNL